MGERVNGMYDIGIVVTAHYSEKLRKHGRKYLGSMVSSVEKHTNIRYKIFVMDNESEIPFESNDRYEVTRFENQAKGGLSRTWNHGAKLAYESGCQVTVICNDDLEFTETINDLFEFCISNEDRQNSLIGPVSPNSLDWPQKAPWPLSGKHPQGRHKNPRAFWHGRYLSADGVVRDTTHLKIGGRQFLLNGFCYAFHREFYEKFNVDGKLWNIDGTENRWGGEEDDLYYRCTPLGMRSLVYHKWFVKHQLIAGWWTLHFEVDK